MPVLPEVPSMIVPPGLSRPARSASSIIWTAMRSLMELPGLKVSIFARTVAFQPLVMELIRTIGVSPMASRMVLQIGFIRFQCIVLRTVACGAGGLVPNRGAECLVQGAACRCGVLGAAVRLPRAVPGAWCRVQRAGAVLGPRAGVLGTARCTSTPHVAPALGTRHQAPTTTCCMY